MAVTVSGEQASMYCTILSGVATNHTSCGINDIIDMTALGALSRIVGGVTVLKLNFEQP